MRFFRILRHPLRLVPDAMSKFCPACYGRRVYCQRCRTWHCLCSWARCPKKKPEIVSRPCVPGCHDPVTEHRLGYWDELSGALAAWCATCGWHLLAKYDAAGIRHWALFDRNRR